MDEARSSLVVRRWSFAEAGLCGPWVKALAVPGLLSRPELFAVAPLPPDPMFSTR